MGSRTLIAVVLTLALSACGGTKTSAVGWSTHHVDDGGFSIETPAAWRTIEKIDSDEEYSRESAEATRGVRAGGVQMTLVRRPAGRAARLSYEYDLRQNGKTKRTVVLQYAFLRGGSEYVVTFSTLPSLRERYRTTFERAARSFRFD